MFEIVKKLTAKQRKRKKDKRLNDQHDEITYQFIYKQCYNTQENTVYHFIRIASFN